MRLLSGILLLSLLLGCGSRVVTQADNEGIDPLDFKGDAAFATLSEFLGVGPRDSGTPGAERAALLIRDSLKARGVEDVRIDAFEDKTPRGMVTFRNVIGVIPGDGEGLVILGSHYDTKSGIDENFVGANDSGSSTAVLIELARLFAARAPSGPDIMLAFFDGEECMHRYARNDGLHGSKRLAAQMVKDGRAKQVRAMILLDMIGDRDLTVTIPRNCTPALVSLALEAAREEGARDKFSLYPFEVGDDHEPFYRAGMPAVNLIDFHYGSARGLNDYWHTSEDTIDKISPESMEIVGRVAIRMLNRLAAAP